VFCHPGTGYRKRVKSVEVGRDGKHFRVWEHAHVCRVTTLIRLPAAYFKVGRRSDINFRDKAANLLGFLRPSSPTGTPPPGRGSLGDGSRSSRR
jgi:hypothetical protein